MLISRKPLKKASKMHAVHRSLPVYPNLLSAWAPSLKSFNFCFNEGQGLHTATLALFCFPMSSFRCPWKLLHLIGIVIVQCTILSWGDVSMGLGGLPWPWWFPPR